VPEEIRHHCGTGFCWRWRRRRRRMTWSCSARSSPSSSSARVRPVWAGRHPPDNRAAWDADYRGVDSAATRVVLLEGGPRLLPMFPKALAARAARDLERLGVEVRTNALVTRITPGGLRRGRAHPVAHRVLGGRQRGLSARQGDGRRAWTVGAAHWWRRRGRDGDRVGDHSAFRMRASSSTAGPRNSTGKPCAR
jgi:hypothetical protein